MRFEHILQIYWTKGYFFGGKLFYFDKTCNELITETPGLGSRFKVLLSDRFELGYFIQNQPQELLTSYQQKNHTPLEKPINVLFSQINSVNHQRTELHRLNIIRLYLIKSYRGRCHAIGKPVRGQRTWSNGWNSFNKNTELRTFISEMRRLIRQNKKEEKINYKVVKKKYASKKKKKKTIKSVKKIWF